MQLSDLGITPVKEKQFNKKGLITAEDLVTFFPSKYQDFRQETGVLPEDNISCIVVRTKKLYIPRGRTKIPYFSVLGTILSNGKPISIVFFHQNFKQYDLEPYMGQDFFLAGKIKYSLEYQNYSVTSPMVFSLLSGKSKKIYPVYPKITGMSEEYLTEKIFAALRMPVITDEVVPPEEISVRKLMTRKEALFALHEPKSMEDIERAKQRFVFDDLLYFAIQNEWSKKTSSPVSPACIIKTTQTQQLIENLPFVLTDDQQSAISEMLENAKKHIRIQALIQGDVGCGKTIIAIIMMSYMAENGYQSVLMAPTQVLAQQHYTELSALMEPFGIKVAFLGTKLKAKEKNKIYQQIANGEISMVVGTHSVLNEKIQYKKLALTIVDEEHRFGVKQRAALVQKASEGVHSITMSATPIPRTLAQVVHGEQLQLYSIHTMPNGRKPVKTGLIVTQEKLFRFIIKEAKQGHQTYVVCPMIDDSDSELLQNVKSVETVSKEYQAALSPYGISVGTLTGRNKKDEVETILSDFKNGKLDVLVSTTVVEVGVNVPTATLMVISNAERFGLASLHQLRGRVGRSDLQSYCVLDSSVCKEDAKARLQVLVDSNDGFVIAEADLKLRGAGDVLGTKQSGDNKYMSLVMQYPEMYDDARQLAVKLLGSNITCPLLLRAKEETISVEDR